MIKKLLLALLFMGLISCSSSSLRKEQAQLHLKIGTSHLMKGHYPQALKVLLEAEKLDPEDPVIQNNLGLAYFVRKEYELALTHMNKALQLNPKYSDARNNLGRVYIELTRYDAAILELNTVTKDLTYPTPEKAYVNLGLAHLKKNDTNHALQSFKKAMEANNRFCPGHNYYGQALFQLQKYEAAADAFENALKLCNNNYDEAHYYTGLCYYKLGQREKAKARLEEVVKLYPDSEYSGKAKSMLKIIQ
ncbi:MAG: tetratricopeptide repeat protein [Oligoflexia bacterium]|nr:tetratricopeptide repeat protein [Oligoflexia bacterium]